MAASTTVPRGVKARPGSGAWFDIGVALVTLAVTTALLTHGLDAAGAAAATATAPLLASLLAVGSALPLIVWRRAPFAVFVGTATAGVLLVAVGAPVDLLLGPAAALGLLAASRTAASPWTPAMTVASVLLLAAFLGAVAAAQRGFPGVALSHTGLAWVAAWAAGERARLRREQLVDLHDRAVHAERDVERERLLAAAEERARIARDLHDSAAHAINLIAVRAGAARLRHAQDPGRCTPALAAIEEVARQTVADIDRIVGSLRANAAPDGRVEAPIGLASLQSLAAMHRAAGLAVSVSTSGGTRPLAAAVDQAAYRVLQEALTNAARHGGGAVAVELVYGASALELSVINPVTAGRSPSGGGGHGLIGLRERVTLLAGTFEADAADGVFHVRARIPYRRAGR